MQKPTTYSAGRPINADEAAAKMQSNGRLQWSQLLADDDAVLLHNNLRSRADWVQVLNSGDRVVELSRDIRAGLADDKIADLDTAVYAGGRYGFQYRYESVRVPDDLARGQGADDPVIAFAQWMNAPAQLETWRTILGQPSINFVDAQATAFSPGDFLTGHDDEIDGKGRHAAYVFSLNPVWRIEWGGLLLFHERDETDCFDRVSGLAPSFNGLNIFRVPIMHSVSLVSKSAASRRYGITGWMRTT